MPLQRLVRTSVRGFCGIAFIAATSCSKDSVEPPLSDLTGIWSVLGQRSAGTCSPSSLPDPIDSNTNLYVQIPNLPESLTGQFRLSQAGGELTLTPVDAQGNLQSDLSLKGSIDTWTGSSQSSGSWSLAVEGPRQGGHTFQVSESATDKSLFFADVLLANGAAGNFGRMSTISRTFVFRDSGMSGPIFTTCFVADTVTGRLLSR